MKYMQTRLKNDYCLYVDDRCREKALSRRTVQKWGSMKEADKKTGKTKKFIPNIIFGIFLGLVVLYMVLGQLLLPEEMERVKTAADVLDVEWSRVLSDGTRVPVAIPCELEADRGERIVIEAVLPQEIPDGMWISFNSLRQEIEIYIDGELRQEFSTLHTGLFGTYSVVGYVFEKIKPQDAGKNIRIVWTTGSIYTGKLSVIYYGERIEIWRRYFGEHLFQVGLAIFLFLFSIVAIVFSAAMSRSFRRKFALGYLGWGMLLTAAWMICESRLRQLFFTNISTTSDVAFLVVGLMPVPYAVYFDHIQKGRYRKYYQALEFTSLAVCLLCTVLHVGHLVDFSDSMRLLHLMILATFVMVSVTMVIDLCRKMIGDYLLIFIGYIGLVAAAVFEIAGIYFAVNRSRTLALAALLLFIMAIVKTGQDIAEMEREKQEKFVISQTKNNFLANMSHEIRTPINSIIGMNELILRESTEQNILEYAGNVDNASKLLLTLVNDILDFSKIESGKMEIVEKAYQLASVLNDEVHLLETKAVKKNLQVVVSIDESLPSTLVGDDMRIRQIITNLITNAVKYTKEGSVAFTVYGAWTDYEKFVLKIAVQDTGIGIRKEDQERLFQRFTRFDLQKNSTVEGCGLGLAITKRLVDLMHGEIYVDSEYGKGSTFSVAIPQEVMSRGPVGDLESAYQEEVLSRKKYHEAFHAPEARVLVVDDNTMNLAVVKGLLKRTEIIVETATSGMECLYMTRQKKYHLILMDHMMPEMDGIETFHKLREEKDNPNADTRVIALTANAIVGSREEYMREGFVDYVTKPIDASELEIVLMSYLPEELIITQEKERERAEELARQRKAEVESQSMDASGAAAESEAAAGNEAVEKTETAAAEAVESAAEFENAAKMERAAETGSARESETMTGGENEMENENARIDKAVGLSHCMDMEDMYAEILQDYCTEGKGYQDKLADCLAKADWKNFAVYVHAVKSSSKTIGAEIFGEEARVLEMAAKEGNIAVIEENWERFCIDFAAVLAAAEKLKGELEGV